MIELNNKQLKNVSGGIGETINCGVGHEFGETVYNIFPRDFAAFNPVDWCCGNVGWYSVVGVNGVILSMITCGKNSAEDRPMKPRKLDF